MSVSEVIAPPTRTVAKSLGLGCAGIFSLAEPRRRRAMVEAAYEAGIRYFDVAPMYGLGQAERELGQFLRHGRDDVRVGTKFGLEMTPLGRLAGKVQSPVRRVLSSSSRIKSRTKAAAANSTSGTLGRLLYEPADFSVSAARVSLQRSLQLLGRPELSALFVHEPLLNLPAVGEELADFLDDCRDSGVIETWGLAGDLRAPGAMSFAQRRGVAVQYRYDLIGRHRGGAPRTGAATTFGFLSGALRAILDRLGTDAHLREHCSRLADVDLGKPSRLAGLLLRDALDANPGGRVLVSTTNREHLSELVADLRPLSDGERSAVDELRAAVTPRAVAP